MALTSHVVPATTPRPVADWADPFFERIAPAPRGERWFTKYRVLVVTTDLVAIVAAVLGTFVLQFSPQDSAALTQTYTIVAPILILAWVFALGLNESRSRVVAGAGLTEYRRVITASIYVFGAVAIVSYALQANLGRSMFITTLPIGISLLLLGRWACRATLNGLRRQGRALTPALVVGHHSSVADVLRSIQHASDAGYRPTAVCVVGDEQGAAVSAPEFADLARVGVAELPDALTDGYYGAVIVADGLPRDQIRQLAWNLENRPVDLMFVPRLADVAGPRMKVTSAEGVSLLHVDLPQFAGWKLILKRAFDIAFALVALVLLAPVFAVIAVAIKRDDPKGPVFFRQERIGRNGQPFTIHKFRTMCVDAEAKIDALIAANGGSALLFKLEDDPRITRIGALLRKYSLDELPQFWSVLRGGMSVVGPRPQVAREVAEYTDMHHRRLLIKPGITGLWQVNGRSELSPEESIRLDLRYVENWSLIGDITVILKTVGVMLRPSGAY